MKAMNAYNELVTCKGEEFEQQRLKLIHDAISSYPPEQQPRLRCQQWRLEQELSKHTDPLDRYNAMVVLFWRGVADFKDALDGKITKPPPCKITPIKG